MVSLQQIQYWSNTHHPRWLVVLRVALGLALFAKGISFMINAVLLDQLVLGNFLSKGVDWLALAITWAHLLGGFMIILGLLTRWAVLLQIPILMGAVIFVEKDKMVNAGSELPFAIMILILLFFFLLEGGGPISLDSYLRKNRER